MTKGEIRNRYVDGLDLLPRHMHAGISRYMERGIEPGGFMLCMLQGKNDEAMLRADPENSAFKDEWGTFLSSYLPEESHGSALKVSAWMKMGGLDGYPDGE